MFCCVSWSSECLFSTGFCRLRWRARVTGWSQGEQDYLDRLHRRISKLKTRVKEQEENNTRDLTSGDAVQNVLVLSKRITQYLLCFLFLLRLRLSSASSSLSCMMRYKTGMSVYAWLDEKEGRKKRMCTEFFLKTGSLTIQSVCRSQGRNRDLVRLRFCSPRTRTTSFEILHQSPLSFRFWFPDDSEAASSLVFSFLSCSCSFLLLLFHLFFTSISFRFLLSFSLSFSLCCSGRRKSCSSFHSCFLEKTFS